MNTGERTVTATLGDLESQEVFETQEGVWVPIYLYNKYMGEIKLINTQISDKYNKRLQRLVKDYRRVKGLKPTKDLPEDDYLGLIKEAMVLEGILDFRNFKEADGTDLPNRDEAGKVPLESVRRLISSKIIWSQILKAVSQQEIFNREVLEELEKN